MWFLTGAPCAAVLSPSWLFPAKGGPFRPVRARGACTSRVLRKSSEPEKDRILILGGGVIGVSVAYHLALRGRRVTVVDHAGIASCASGKAGGFLARDWNDGTPLRDLTRKSFDMHAEVAQELGLQSYRRLRCKAVTVGGDFSKPASRKLASLEWVDSGAQSERFMGDESTTAQVHPKDLTEAMWKACEEKVGSEFLLGTVNEVLTEDVGDEKRIKGAMVNGEDVLADTVVCCMGPWAQVLRLMHPQFQVYGVKYHSVLLQSERVLSEAVFFNGMGDPEVYPRGDGENYITGFPDPPTVVSETPGNVQVREDVCERLTTTVCKVSADMQSATLTGKQSCYLPFTADSLPAMGQLPRIQGGYVCVGHGCWGILNSLASGLGMSELIVDGKATSVDIAPFHPDRLLADYEPEWAPSS